MPTKRKVPSTTTTGKSFRPALADEVQAAIAWLERNSSKKYRDGLARYGIVADRPFGVSMAKLNVFAKRLGRNHELAGALWENGRYEARMLATLVDEPERVTSAQMERWAKDFDNWAICDTACFKLFDRSPHAWGKVAEWCERRAEFEKRAGFALLASLALHDKTSGDGPFIAGLRLVERGAVDDRNFVKKAANWALRAIGGRSSTLHAAALKVAQRLAESKSAAPRWVGKDALRALNGPVMKRRIAGKRLRAKK